MSMNDELKLLYESWKCGLDRDDPSASQLSPPSLVSVTASYEVAERRVLVIGQEDRGNPWSQKGLRDYPGYAAAGIQWPYDPISTWADFLAVENSVEALMYGCQSFSFAEHQPEDRSRRYWQTFLNFTDRGLGGAATNLDRASFDGGAIEKAPIDVQDFLRSQQGGLLQKEVAILQPHACLFFTGPNRDWLIDLEWPGLEKERVSDSIPERQLCRLIDKQKRLPARTYRMYHPAYRRWNVVSDLLNELHRLTENGQDGASDRPGARRARPADRHPLVPVS